MDLSELRDGPRQGLERGEKHSEGRTIPLWAKGGRKLRACPKNPTALAVGVVRIGGEKVLIVAALASEAQRNPEFRAVLHRACAVVEECDKEVKTLKS